MIRAGIVFGLALLVLLSGIPGCNRTPFIPDMPRTPYARYQDLRGGEPPQTEPDSFGNQRPALRARLEPMDRP